MNQKRIIRQSNFELLRIVCMYNILLCHLLFHGCNGLQLNPCVSKVSVVIEAFLSFHVNAFLLISGYFGIRFHFKSLLKFILPCAFYSVLIYLLFEWSGDHLNSINIKGLLKRFAFICRDSPWWFVEKYFYLFLTAPIFNIALKYSKKRELQIILVLLLLVNIGIGGVMHSDFNRNGFCYNHFVLMYMLGGYIARFGIELKSSRLILGYIFTSILIVLPPHIVRGYVNPFVIIQAICVFLLFEKMRFQSRWINYLAASTFSVYLIHDEDVYSRPFLRVMVANFYSLFSSDWCFLLGLIIVSIIAFIGLIFVDKLFKYTIVDRLYNMFNCCYNNIKTRSKLWVHL